MIVLTHKKPGPGYKWVGELWFTPDGRALITGGHIGGHIWYGLPAADGRHDFPAIQWVRRARFTARGEVITLGAGSLEFTSITSRSTRTLELQGIHVETFDLTPNGRSILFGATERRSNRSWVRYAPLTDFSDAGARWSHEFELPRHSEVWCLDAKRYLLVTKLDDKRRMRYSTGSLKTGAPRETVENEWVGYQSLASPDGRFFVMVMAAQLVMFSTDDFSQPLAIVKNPGKQHFTGIAFHPSGKYLAATSNDKTVKLYDTTSWELARTFTWDIGKMRSIAFSPDGTLAAAGSDTGKVVVWDVDL
jgi:WD40 repeat protein